MDLYGTEKMLDGITDGPDPEDNIWGEEPDEDEVYESERQREVDWDAIDADIAKYDLYDAKSITDDLVRELPEIMG